MNWRQWLVIMGVFFMYLLFGGAVFMAVEAPLEDISKQQLYSLQKKIYG